MSHFPAPDEFPDHPGFTEKYNEMNRNERKAEMKRQRHEVLYGNDSIFWSMFNDAGERIVSQEWFVKMPSDRLTSILVQAQNNMFRILSERRKQDAGTPRYEELSRQLAAQNDKINFLQECLNQSNIPREEPAHGE
jgi:hypothetical protein